MNVVYLHQYFRLPSEPGGQRSYSFAKGLVGAGHRVTMITSNSTHPDWGFIERQSVDGIDVIYVKNAYMNSMGAVARIWSFLKFMIVASGLAMLQPKVNLVFATSTPLTIAVPAVLLKFFRRVPFVFEVRDMWPDVPWEMGMLRQRWIFRILKSFEGFVYSYSDHIVAISNGIRELVGHPGRTTVLPFGANIDLFTHRLNKDNETFTVLFTGAVGNANGPEYLVEVAKLVQDRGDSNIEFVMVGNGSAKEKIANLVSEYSLKNFQLHDAVPIADLQHYFFEADVGVILFGDQSHTYRITASPNKFFDYLAAGLPMIYNFEGPLKQYCLDQKIGFYVDFQNPASMFNLIVDLKNKKAELEIMANKIRFLAETKFNRVNIVEEFTALIENHAA
jgi:glycosyltransferase involved in cell wall biosynthesis